MKRRIQLDETENWIGQNGEFNWIRRFIQLNSPFYPTQFAVSTIFVAVLDIFFVAVLECRRYRL